MSRALVLFGLVLAGCGGGGDLAIGDVVSLQLQPNGDVKACARYATVVSTTFDGETDYGTRFRLIRVDTKGALADLPDACSGTSPMPGETPLSDGGRLLFANSNLQRIDAAGAIAWTVPSPFGHISAASDDDGTWIYLARGPQVARVALADGSVSWISELR